MDPRTGALVGAAPQQVKSPLRQNGAGELAQFGCSTDRSPGSSPESLAYPGGTGRRLVAALGAPGGAALGPAGGGATPPRSRPRGKVLMLTPGSSGAGRSDASPGPSILAAVKRELELLEAKLFAEMEQQVGNAINTAERSDKIRDMAFQRIEKKLADHDEAMARVDKRAAETIGQVRGLHEEVLSSSRQACSVDARLRDFHHKIEEEFRNRCSDIEAHSKELISKIRGVTLAHEDVQAKLTQTARRLDGAVQDVSQNNDMLAQALALQQERLQAVEDAAAKALADLQDRLLVLENGSKASASQVRLAEVSVDSRLRDVEQQVKEHSLQVGRLHTVAHGDNGWDLRLQDHEVRLTALRSKLESYEWYSDKVDETVRERWGSQIDKLERVTEETMGRHRDIAERHEVLARQADTRHEAVLDRLQQLEHSAKGLHLFVAEEEVPEDDELLSGNVSPAPQALMGLQSPGSGPTSQELRGAISLSTNKFAAPRSPEGGAESPNDGALTLRVGALVNQLTALVPQMHKTEETVTSHADRLEQLTHRVEGVESSVKKLLDQSTSMVQTITAHAEGATRAGCVPSGEDLLPLEGENLDELLQKYDSSEAKILDAHSRLRQRMDNFQHLLEAADRKAAGAAPGPL